MRCIIYLSLFKKWTQISVQALEGQPSGFLLGTIHAKDPDEGENGTIFYSMSGKNDASVNKSINQNHLVSRCKVYSDKHFVLTIKHETALQCDTTLLIKGYLFVNVLWSNISDQWDSKVGGATHCHPVKIENKHLTKWLMQLQLISFKKKSTVLVCC